MKRHLPSFAFAFAVAIALVAGAAPARAATAAAGMGEGPKIYNNRGPFGLGLIIGEPTALSGKLYLTRGNALDFAASWSARYKWVGGMADYTYQFWDVLAPIADRQVYVPFYVGIGGAMFIDTDSGARGPGTNKSGNDVALGARIPLGIGMSWRDFPLELFLEIAAVAWVLPGLEPDAMGGLGVRYYF